MSVVDLPLSEAVEELTGFEVLGIQTHYGSTMEQLGAIKLVLGAVWAYANRAEKTSWQKVESMTLKQLNSYFGPEPVVADEESELGKESPSANGRHATSPSGPSTQDSPLMFTAP